MAKQSRDRNARRREGAVLAAIEALNLRGFRLNAEQRAMTAAPARCRAVFSDHPCVGLGARRDTPAGSAKVSSFNVPAAHGVETTDPATTEALPVLLVEPPQALHWHSVNGDQAELQVQAMCREGFTLWTDVAILRRVLGWTLRRTDGEHLELHGRRGLWAHTTLSPAPEWLAAAVSQHDVLVIYGPAIGVEIDPTLTAPTEEGRRGELEEFKRIGYVAAGIVSYQS